MENDKSEFNNEHSDGSIKKFNAENFVNNLKEMFGDQLVEVYISE